MTRRGFSLIELVIIVAIVSILAAIALPQYQATIYRTKAAEAYLMLGRAKDAQYSWFANWNCFAPLRRTPETGYPPSHAKNIWTSNSSSIDDVCGTTDMGFIDIDIGGASATYYFYECERQIDPADFTCNALGDLDNNGDLAEFIYCTDHSDTGRCLPSSTGQTSLFPFIVLIPQPGVY